MTEEQQGRNKLKKNLNKLKKNALKQEVPESHNRYCKIRTSGEPKEAQKRGKKKTVEKSAIGKPPCCKGKPAKSPAKLKSRGTNSFGEAR